MQACKHTHEKTIVGRRPWLRRRASLISAAGICLLLAVAATPALGARSGIPGPNEGQFNPASDTEGNHCTNRFGVDLNSLFGVSEQLITSRCTTASAGEYLIPLGFSWYTNTSYAVIPAGFTPAAPTPMEDFLAKLVSVTLVIDAGTRQEQTYVYPAASVTKLVTLDQENPFQPAYPNAEFLTKLQPLSVGTHTADTSWFTSAEHWDGLSADPNSSMLPAGVLGGLRRTFTVEAGAAQSG